MLLSTFMNRFLPVRSLFGLCLFTIAALPSPATALNLGFESEIALEASDNIEGDNSQDAQQGVVQSGIFGVYGEQRARLFEAQFRGELDVQNVLADGVVDGTSNITRFLGAAQYKVTPRSWRWFVGDILGGVREDDGIQSVSYRELDQRNIFITGPSFTYDISDISQTSARLLYVNQSQDNADPPILFTFDFAYDRDLPRDNRLGVLASHIYTDSPSQRTQAQANASPGNSFVPGDYYRNSLSAWYFRSLGLYSVYTELGGTHYAADDGSLSGVKTLLSATRRLGPDSRASLTLSRDLYDQSLSSANSLIASGSDAVGVELDASGFFNETRLEADLALDRADSLVRLGAGLALIDYRLLSALDAQDIRADLEDRQQGYVYASWLQRLNGRLSTELILNLETQDYDNLDDNSDSLLITSQLIYRLARSLDVRLLFSRDQSVGTRTRFATGEPVSTDFDATENRVYVGLRWQPPSRASQELTIELKSLLLSGDTRVRRLD